MKKITLKDGLRVITIPQKNTKTVSILALVAVGSRYEKKDIVGISHFLEHMVFKGTKKRKTFNDIATEIDKVGGLINAFTGKEFTGFWSKVAAPHFDVALDIVSDIVQNPKLSEEEIEKEKGVICEEINMYEDTPRENIHNIFEEVIFPENPLGWRQIGKKDVIRSITQKDFKDYMERFYGANNAVITVAGNIDPEKTAKKVDDAFNLRVKNADKNYKKIEGEVKGPNAKIVSKKTEQAHMIVGAMGYDNYDPRKYASKILGVILAGGMSSRLFNEIREKRGLAYYVRGMSHSYRDTGYLMIQSGVDNNKVEETLKVIISELIKLRDQGLREGELEKAKEFFKGNLAIHLEDSAELAEFYGSKELMDDKLKTVDEVISAIDQIKEDDILEVAKDLFQSKNLNLAAIGNIKNKEKINNLLEV